MGHITQTEVYEGDLVTRLERTQNTYVDSSDGLPSGIHFVYLSESTTTVWQDGQPRDRRQAYQYNPADQDGIQYGNQTRVYEYQADGNLYRIKAQVFDPNANAWIVNKPSQSFVADSSWNVPAFTYYLYDDQTTFNSGPGSEGRLTLTRAAKEGVNQPVPDGHRVETVDARYGYDDYGNLTSTAVFTDYGWIEFDAQAGAWLVGEIGGGESYTTTTDYDPTYHLYPLAVTDPLAHTSHTEYYGVNGAPLDGFPTDSFSVRWTGRIRAPRAGRFRIYVNTDDGVRVWIDDTRVVNDWVDRGPTDSTAEIDFSDRLVRSIRIEYYERGGGAQARLEWSGPGLERQVVPKECLYSGSP